MRHFFKLTVLFLFILSVRGSAQKLSYGIELDPTYHLRKDGEFNFAGGGFVALDISDRFVLSTGVKIGWQHLSDIDYGLYPCDLDNIEMVLETGESSSFLEFNHKSKFIGLPLQARYNLSDKENHFYLNYNFTYWMRLSTISHGTHSACGEIISDQQPIQKIYDTYAISNALGFGFEFELKKHVSIYLEPRIGISYYLKDIDNSYDFPEITYETRQTDLGLSVGIRFR